MPLLLAVVVRNHGHQQHGGVQVHQNISTIVCDSELQAGSAFITCNNHLPAEDDFCRWPGDTSVQQTSKDSESHHAQHPLKSRDGAYEHSARSYVAVSDCRKRLSAEKE